MPRTPRSTYRLQLHKDFNFDDAAAVAGYLGELGISHVYCSPYLQAAPGSTHGYDVVDHQRVNEELGGAAGHERFSKRLGEVGLGQVLDIVPKPHVAGSREPLLGGTCWRTVLPAGMRRSSISTGSRRRSACVDKVLVPILSDQYGRVLQSGGIKIVRNGALFRVECAGQVLPLAPNTHADDSCACRGVLEVGHVELPGGIVRPAARPGVHRPPDDSCAASRQDRAAQSAGAPMHGRGRRSASRSIAPWMS